MKMRYPLKTLGFVAILAAAAFVFPASSSAYVFWSNSGGTPSIGRANHDGSGVNQSFATSLTGVPRFMDVAGGYVYWGTTVSGVNAVIGRSNLAGTSVNASYMTFGTQTPKPGVSIDDSYVYWTDQNASGTGNSGPKVQRVALSNVATGRANIATWSTAQSDAPNDVANDGTDLFWSKGGSIYRASKGTINQSNVTPWVTPPGLTSIQGVAVDSTYVYYADTANARIGRISKSDGSVDPNFITDLNNGVVGTPVAATPYGIEVDSQHVYWADPANDVIGRAPIAGSSAPEGAFVTGATDPYGVAVTDAGWDGDYVFFTQDAVSTGSQIVGATDIGRALSNGEGLSQEFGVSLGGSPGFMAGGQNHVFWGTETPYASGNTRIGRAVIDGSSVNGNWKTFGTSAQDRRAVAVHGRELFWLNRQSSAIGRYDLKTDTYAGNHVTGIGDYASGIAADSSGIYWSANFTEIWRANLDGSGAARWVTVPSAQYLEGIAVDSGYLYFADRPNGRIGRVTKSSLAVDPDFVTNLSTGVPGPVVPTPSGVAVSRDYIYWADYSNDTVGRAPIGGSSAPEGNFLSGLNDPIGVAISAPAPDLTATSAGVGFGDVDILDLAPLERDVVFNSSGLTPVSLESPVLSGTDAADFSVISDGCASEILQPGVTCTVRIGFDPQTAGSKTALLTLASSSSNSPESVVLAGAAIDPPSPAVTFSARPPKQTKSRVARFRFSSDQELATFECRIDGRGWETCISPKTFTNLRPGSHLLRIRATVGPRTGSTAEYRWKVIKADGGR